MRSAVLEGLALCALCVAGAANAQERHDQNGNLLLRVNGPITLAEQDSASTVVVVGGDASVRGRVIENLIVVAGHARITGSVGRDVLVTRGVLELAPTARVNGNIVLYQSQLKREPGSVVGGQIQSRTAPAFGQWFAVGFWVSMTIAVLAFGLLFAAVAGRQLSDAAGLVAHRVGAAMLSALATWGAATLIIFGLMASVIGIPLGIAIAIILLPALGFCGYVVSGAALGRAMLRRGGQWTEHPYSETALGLAVLQAAGFVPVIGALAALVASFVGAGALVYRTWIGRRGQQPPMPEMKAAA